MAINYHHKQSLLNAPREGVWLFNIAINYRPLSKFLNSGIGL